MQAVELCLRPNIKSGATSKHIHIHSDSRVALLALKLHEVTSKLARGCLQILILIASRNRVHFIWTSGYNKVMGNKVAVIFAKKEDWASTEDNTQAKPFNPKISTSSTETLLQLTKHEVRIVTGFLTGHWKHLYNLVDLYSGQHRLCHEKQEISDHTTKPLQGSDFGS